MGRGRKPIDNQRGNLTQEQKEKIKQSEELVLTDKTDLDKVPSWLIDKVAKDEWKRLVKNLKKIDIIGNLDINNLGVYCNTFSQYRKITAAISKVEILRTDENEDAMNYVFERLSNQQRYCADELRKYAGTLGLTIDSRLKAGAIKGKDKDDEIEDEFGDI